MRFMAMDGIAAATCVSANPARRLRTLLPNQFSSSPRVVKSTATTFLTAGEIILSFRVISCAIALPGC